MCSFIGFKCYPKDIKENIKPVWELLKVKGGDETSFVVLYNDFVSKITTEEINNSFKDKVKNKLITEETSDVYMQENISELINRKIQILDVNRSVYVIGFSRLTPEMEESNNSLTQPYQNIIDNSIITVHGTIPNAEEIAKKNNISINVDTELFHYLDFDYVCKEVEKVGGKISAMRIKFGEKTKYYQNGLGLYQFHFQGDKPTIGNAADILIDTNIDCRNIDTTHKLILQNSYSKNLNKYPTRIISLFSGGLDITCATQKTISNLNAISGEESIISEMNLWYFDWDTRARDGEILAGKNASVKIYDKYKIPVSFETIKVKKMFKNILSACDMTGTRLSDDNAKGAGNHEAEAAISYVPYRNTFLLTLAAARAEQLYPNEHIKFVIGANLSEGMIYLDNSETWLTHANHIIKVGGQSCEKFEVVAPYVNRTKTEMVKDAIFENFFLDSYSCYFPKIDGSSCDECGSCLLKKNALKRGNDDNS